jgi:hypothetical protein
MPQVLFCLCLLFCFYEKNDVSRAFMISFVCNPEES